MIECAHLLMKPGMVDSSSGVRLEVCPPRKAGTVFTQEKPWESFYIHTHTIVRHNGEFLLYYLVYIINDGPKRSESCLATSSDGIHWERPELGQVEYAGSKANNILAASGTVSINPLAPPERRFLMTGVDRRIKQGEPGFVLDSVALYTSPDGRVWEQATSALSPFTHDSTNQVFFDTAKGKYVAYLRACPPGLGRAVAYFETDNVFEPWPIRPSSSNKPSSYTTPYGPIEHHYVVNELPIAISGKPGLETYNPAVMPLNDMYIALPDIFRIFPGPHHPDKDRFPGCELFAWSNDGLVAPRLYVSADGVSFSPVAETPYIDIGCADDPDTRQVRMVTGLAECGNEVWQYYSAHRTGHTLARGQRAREACAVVRTVQRRDGYAAIVAGSAGGEVVTSPVRVTGAHLCVNFDAGAWGEIRIELLDTDRRVIAGYGLFDSAPLVGNEVYERAQWSDGRNLAGIIGNTLRVRFVVENARLFSFRFEYDKGERFGTDNFLCID